jgi:signal transduction histidine kinase
MNEQNHVSEESLELSKMFHEIKNPLALINSSLQLIESDHPEVKTFRFWNQTMKDLQGLRRLIDELSTFQKGSVLNKTTINLFDFTEDLLEAVEAFFLEREIPFILENEIDDLDFVADDTKLRQAIINLLKNAAESSEPGSPVELHTSVQSDSLIFSITDHGCGISEEQMEHLLEPFHTTKSYGTGLGLPIVKRIIDAHNGVFQFISKEGEGTTVQVALPINHDETFC